ncbi:MAG: hypothetical protein ACRDSP_27055 [Pseudonocardiaceae bacterium]
MGKHDDKITSDGRGQTDPRDTKDVQDAGGGKHSSDDRGEQRGQQGQGDNK